jgi:hypothetical protein
MVISHEQGVLTNFLGFGTLELIFKEFSIIFVIKDN